MLLFFAVLELHFALFLPVELLVDVLGGSSDREFNIDDLNNFVLHFLVLDSFKLRVLTKVLSNNLIGYFN